MKPGGGERGLQIMKEQNMVYRKNDGVGKEKIERNTVGLFFHVPLFFVQYLISSCNPSLCSF